MQLSEYEKLQELLEERRRLEAAEMTAFAFHDPKKLRSFDLSWQARVRSVTSHKQSREELEREADELWALHEAALRRRPVS